MLGFVHFAATTALTAVGYFQARQFVLTRLRFVDAVHTMKAPILAGVGAALIAAPLLAFMPLVGMGTAALFGIGVGSGVAAGSRAARHRLEG